MTLEPVVSRRVWNCGLLAAALMLICFLLSAVQWEE